MHFDLFTATDPNLLTLMSDCEVPTAEPLRISPWLAMSALQKGIRRDDVDLATRAAATLLRSDPARLWRRLCGIAFEDVSLADPDCVRLVMAATSGKTFRQQYGGDHRVTGLVVTRMCEARKCRATDDLFIAVSHHHELEAVRADLAGHDLPQHLSHVRERGALLGASLAALHASGVRWTGQVAGRRADAAATFAAMRSGGIDPEIVALAEQGFRRTREAIEAGAIFPSMDKHGNILPERVTGEVVTDVLKARVSAAGYDPSGFSAHSLRSGFATSAAMAGATCHKIRQVTGHRSEAGLAPYLRTVDLFTDSAAARVL